MDTKQLDGRDTRAIIIAAMCQINRQNGAWVVPSQSAPDKRYEVKLDGNGSCTCPDNAENGHCCKHIRAVRITMKRELGMNGEIVETKQLLFEEKKVYRQEWAAYNAAQCVEKDRFQVLLQDLLREIPEVEHPGRGPKPHLAKDSLFAMAFKVYTMFSARRFSSDLRTAHEQGFLSRPVPGVKVCQFMENKAFTPILKELIAKSAAPLKMVETEFAVDSSGFSTNRFTKWFDKKYGVTKEKADWVKAHICCGVKTNVVTAVRILDQDAADCPQFKPLVKATAKTFSVAEVSADKAYASLENFEVVDKVGGTGFIAFKANTTGTIGGLFEKMFGYFTFRQTEFLNHYHKRSNVESTFSAVKRKFGDSVKSKTDVAMTNEVLCKFLAHNICCLIQEEHELGIDPVFWPEAPCQLKLAE